MLGFRLESTEPFSFVLSLTQVETKSMEEEAKPGWWEGKKIDEDKVPAETTDIWLGQREELDGELGLQT